MRNTDAGGRGVSGTGTGRRNVLGPPKAPCAKKAQTPPSHHATVLIALSHDQKMSLRCWRDIHLESACSTSRRVECDSQHPHKTLGVLVWSVPVTP